MAKGWLDHPYNLENKKIWVAGHAGMVGAAVLRALQFENCKILTAPRSELDLRDQAAVKTWMDNNKPDVIILAAAKVGGILANDTHPAEFLYDNLMIESNVIHGAYESGVEKLLFLGSSCIYPKNSVQPIMEEALLTGRLESTNEFYAIAKIAGLKMCEAYRKQYGCDFISAMPCNLYGPHDRFDPQNSHVIPALMMKAHEAKISGAKTLSVWGSGKPLREFMHVDDLAKALIFMLKKYSGKAQVNIGGGVETTIGDLAQMIAAVVGFEGVLTFDETKPDGTMRKVMDSSKIVAAGWRSSIGLEEGLQETYQWYQGQVDEQRAA